MRNAQHRYIRSFIPAMALYAGVLVISILILRQWGEALPIALRALVALAPVLPIGFACRAMVRYVRECDELERRIELESIALASLTVGMVYLCVGFLAVAKVLPVHGGIAALWVFPALCGTYGLTKWFASRNYA